MATDLNDYMAHGWTLSDHNLLEFRLTTMELEEKHARYLKWFHYLENSTQAGWTRVSQLMQALPFFSGELFPWCDDPPSYGLHFAMVMTLLKPWRVVSTICSAHTTWEIMFELFHALADRRTQLFVENIQFYYEAQDTISYLSYETVKKDSVKRPTIRTLWTSVVICTKLWKNHCLSPNYKMKPFQHLKTTLKKKARCMVATLATPSCHKGNHHLIISCGNIYNSSEGENLPFLRCYK